ncbi:hypothetical protein [Desulfobacter latus]|uniref:Acetyltransferase n=1 Tax=Desulfobacter latus TaxID=2292 RepID=A0A850SXT3_9BACT|nr:hypothetical protein [Desulfobacter latus]NWH04960.1 hypothetical protein [Desulfobacter latus]
MNKLRKVAVIGWHDGFAGFVQAFAEAEGLWQAECFVEPEEELPEINAELDFARRPCSQFDYPQKGKFKGRDLIVSRDWIGEIMKRDISGVVLTDHDIHRRRRILNGIRESKLELVSTISNNARIMQEVKLEPGVIICANATIEYRAEIGSGTFVCETGFVGHHSVLKECVDIACATVDSNVLIEECATLNSGAVVMSHVKVGSGATVGIGSVVIEDVPEAVTVFGNPARIVWKKL